MQQTSAVSAKAWILMDYANQSYLRGANTQQKRQIASITKMYTLFSCLSLNKLLKITPETTYIKIFDSQISGTSAQLAINEYISVMDLYYALMLPSGNDAACVLACYYGCWLVGNSKGSNIPYRAIRKQDIGDRLKYSQLYCKKFVQYMNKYIVKQELNHTNTHFENPHGLSDKNQTSSVWQLAEAAIKFMKQPLFAAIANCHQHRGYYYQSEIAFEWYNTNALLKQGYGGIKTGYTTTAGGCLASLTSIKINKYEQKPLLIIVLGSSNAQSRFEDTRQIVRDYQKYLKMMRLS